MHLLHAAVWIDRNEAKIFHIDDESFDVTKVRAPHRHIRRQTAEHDHPADREHYYEEVAKQLEGIEEILIVGPAKAKLELVKHVHARHPSLVSKIIGVETSDHPTDGQLAAHVREYFRAADRLR